MENCSDISRGLDLVKVLFVVFIRVPRRGYGVIIHLNHFPGYTFLPDDVVRTSRTLQLTFRFSVRPRFATGWAYPRALLC